MSFLVVKLKGFKELEKALEKAGEDTNQLRELHSRMARLMVAAVKPRAPVGKTGKLKSSIRAIRGKNTAGIRGGNSAVPYAAPRHWGWPARNITKNEFAWVTLRANEAEWIQMYQKELEKIIQSLEVANGSEETP